LLRRYFGLAVFSRQLAAALTPQWEDLFVHITLKCIARCEPSVLSISIYRVIVWTCPHARGHAWEAGEVVGREHLQESSAVMGRS
jgi:hypothetical protein